MKHFIISDTHFNHANIIKYANRPFDNVEQMNKVLIDRWNATVGNNIVWHLGDFGLGKAEQLKPIVSMLKGRIRLVLGNHDKLPVSDYYALGFEYVYNCDIVVFNKFYFSHRPPTTPTPFFHYFGHLHNEYNASNYSFNHKCVCVEHTNYTPQFFFR